LARPCRFFFILHFTITERLAELFYFFKIRLKCEFCCFHGSAFLIMGDPQKSVIEKSPDSLPELPLAAERTTGEHYSVLL